MATATWTGLYNHRLIAGIWFRGSFGFDEYLEAPPRDSYDYKILVTGTETVWVLFPVETDAVGLTVTVHPSLPPRPEPTRPLTRVHPLEPSTARVFNQTRTVQFCEPGEIWIGADTPIKHADLAQPSPLAEVSIPPDKYSVRASLWLYAYDGPATTNLGEVTATDNVDQIPAQIHVQFWPRA